MAIKGCSSITGTSPSDCLELYTGHSLVGAVFYNPNRLGWPKSELVFLVLLEVVICCNNKNVLLLRKLFNDPYIYVVHSISFQTFFFFFFCTGIWNWRRLLIQYLMRWQTNFYDSSFKWTATAAIGIHPTEAWLSQLVIFKNAIWHFRRTICNKIVF